MKGTTGLHTCWTPAGGRRQRTRVQNIIKTPGARQEGNRPPVSPPEDRPQQMLHRTKTREGAQCIGHEEAQTQPRDKAPTHMSGWLDVRRATKPSAAEDTREPDADARPVGRHGEQPRRFLPIRPPLLRGQPCHVPTPQRGPPRSQPQTWAQPRCPSAGKRITKAGYRVPHGSVHTPRPTGTPGRGAGRKPNKKVPTVCFH